MKVLSVQSFKVVRVECRSPYRTKGAIRDGHLRLQLIVYVTQLIINSILQL